jgi:hypothetical protein
MESRKLATFQLLIAPEMPIHKDVQQVHGITRLGTSLLSVYYDQK